MGHWVVVESCDNVTEKRKWEDSKVNVVPPYISYNLYSFGDTLKDYIFLFFEHFFIL